MKNKQKRSEAMESDEKIVRVETLDELRPRARARRR